VEGQGWRNFPRPEVEIRLPKPLKLPSKTLGNQSLCGDLNGETFETGNLGFQSILAGPAKLRMHYYVYSSTHYFIYHPINRYSHQV
jgi:hypothetical protein